MHYCSKHSQDSDTPVLMKYGYDKITKKKDRFMCAICDSEYLNSDFYLKLLEKEITENKLKANIDPFFMDVTLDTYPVETEKQKNSVDQLKNFHVYGSRNILMMGHTGVGKTTLAIGLIDRFIKNERSACYEQFYTLIEVRDQHYENFKKMLNTDLLVIDEVGRELTDAKVNLLFRILDHRLRNLKPTALISNLDPESLAKAITLPIYSRLKGNSIIINFDSKDYRTGKEHKNS